MAIRDPSIVATDTAQLDALRAHPVHSSTRRARRPSLWTRCERRVTSVGRHRPRHRKFPLSCRHSRETRCRTLGLLTHAVAAIRSCELPPPRVRTARNRRLPRWPTCRRPCRASNCSAGSSVIGKRCPNPLTASPAAAATRKSETGTVRIGRDPNALAIWDAHSATTTGW